MQNAWYLIIVNWAERNLQKNTFFMSFLVNSYIRESHRISKRFFDD